MNGATSSHGRRWLMVLGILGLVVAALFAPSGKRTAKGDESFRIVCTFLPNYVFALNVAGDVPGVKVQMMVPGNVGCPHDYSLSARDRMLVESADVIVANGLGVEGFVQDLLTHRGEELIILSRHCELLARRDYRQSAVHPPVDDHDADHADHDHAAHDHPQHEHGAHDGECDHPDHAHGHKAHGHASEWNPHVWVSVKEAMTQVRTLAEELARHDPAHAEAYWANAAAYLARLAALQEEVEELAGRFERTNIATLHDAFDYLARDLGLNVVTTLERLPGVAPAAGELKAIIEQIRSHRVAVIFTEPAYSDRLARTIGRETGAEVVSLDPFTSTNVSVERIEATAYEDVMRRNLDQLSEVLGVRGR